MGRMRTCFPHALLAHPHAPKMPCLLQREEESAKLDVTKASGHLSALMGCRTVHCFKKLNSIDGGSYGDVFRGQDLVTKEVVALKKIKINRADKLGFPITSLREINILQMLKHPNIVGLKEVVTDGKLDR